MTVRRKLSPLLQVSLMDLTIDDSRDRISEAAQVAGAAFIHDPSEHTQQVWRDVAESSRAQRYSRIFALTLALPGRNLLTAVSSNQVVGCLCFYHSRHTHLSLGQKLKMLIPFILASGRSFRRFLKLQQLIEELVPEEETLHVGPLAVQPEYQGHGVGSRLLQNFVTVADRDQMSAFLQTGKPENVALYEKFGFGVVRTAEFEGAPVWAMTRSPR